MKIAIQIVTYKNADDLPAVFASLRAQTFTDWTLFVYENSCDRAEAGRVQALLEKSGWSHHFFISDRNTGFAGGHQTLFAMSDEAFILLLNPDATLASDYLEKAMRRMESDEKIGSVTGLVYRAEDKRMVDTAGLEYHCLGHIVDRFSGLLVSKLPSTIYGLLSSEVFGISAAIGLYRRSAVDAAGGLFDPSWFMYKEDADLAMRLKRAGYSAWFEPTAVAYHRRGLKEEGGRGILARIKNERSRPAILRQYTYANQWRMYRRYWKTIGWRDKIRTIGIEILRSALAFLVSPRVFFRAWKYICFQK